MAESIIEIIDVTENKIVFTLWGHTYTIAIPRWVVDRLAWWYESEDA